MIWSRTRIAGFAAVVVAATAVLMAVPSPYGEGIAVDRHTGGPRTDVRQRLQAALATGDAAAALFALRPLVRAGAAGPLVAGTATLLERELGPLQLRPLAELPDDRAALVQALLRCAADDTGQAVESLFGNEAVAPTGVDARAARLQRRAKTNAAPDARAVLAMAAEFGRSGRPRARWRWLLRALAWHPDATAAVDGVLEVLIAEGRLHEAVAVGAIAQDQRGSDAEFWRQRARLGAWTSNATVEAAALERLVALRGDPADRGRLVEIYGFIGESQRALPHAIALADGASAIATAEAAAKAALTAGFVDEGLDMLQRAAARAVDPSPWLRRLADFALQDLRIDRVAEALERVASAAPDAEDHQLEALYRRVDRPAALADLLQRRLARTPEDRALWDEVIALRYGLGDRLLARTLVVQREAALADPVAFLHRLPPELRGPADDARRQALSLALAGEVHGTIVGEVIERLRPFLQLPEFRAAADALLLRHKDDPRSKPLRIELLDLGRTPVEAAQAAAELAATYPEDAELVRLWVDRASWADQPALQREARLRLYELEPTDRQNRHALAELHDLLGERNGALAVWRELVREEGTLSPAVPHLINALFASGDEVGALELLQQLAADPRATTAQQLQAAEELFGRGGFDRAKVLYAAVLDREPAAPLPLLRLGQIHAFANDPRAARPFFERRLEASAADAPLVRFYLGETLWATGEAAAARAQQEVALQAMQQVAQPDFTTQSLIATMLARLGRRSEAAAAYRLLVGQNPRDVDLVLDYLDVLVGERRLDVAGALLRHARVLDASGARLLRLQGDFEQQCGDYAAADRSYSRAIELHGADAGLCSDQGQARYRSGDWDGALASFQRWLQLQSDSIAARRLVTEVGDQLATAVVAQTRALRIGDDRVVESYLGCVLPFDDRGRLHVRVGEGHYHGRAAALAAGEGTLDTGLLDLGLEQRLGTNDRFAIGVSAAPGASGDVPLGAFAALHLERSEPFAALELRAAVHELWTEPAAAAVLGGRRSGLSAQGYADLGGGLWTTGALAVDVLGIDPDGTAPVQDLRWRGELSLGQRFLDGDVAVSSPFSPRQAPAGPSCPFLLAAPSDTRAWLGNAWLSWQSARLVGDAELPALLPLLAADEHLFAAVRIDRHLTTGLGVSLAGHAGTDLRTGAGIWGVDAALTWRPADLAEVSFAASHGSALGRAGGGDVDELRLEVVWRW